MKQFNIMRDDLLVANEEANSNFPMYDSHRFYNKTRKHERWLCQMRIPTKMMQTSFRKLSDCRKDLDFLIVDISEHEKERI